METKPTKKCQLMPRGCCYEEVTLCYDFPCRLHPHKTRVAIVLALFTTDKMKSSAKTLGPPLQPYISLTARVRRLCAVESVVPEKYCYCSPVTCHTRTSVPMHRPIRDTFYFSILPSAGTGDPFLSNFAHCPLG